MLEDKQSKYIHEFVKRKEYSIVGKMRRNGFSQRDVDRQWNQIVNMIRKKQISGVVVANMAAISSSVADAYFKVKLVSIIGLISVVIGLVMEEINYDSMIPIYECMKGICLGLGVGALVTMVLYTTGLLEKIKNRKSKQMKIVAIFCFGIMAICIIVSLILSII